MKNLEDLEDYKAYLVDWDGTVADTSKIHVESHRVAFEYFGLDMPAEQVEGTVDNLWPALRERYIADWHIRRIENYIGEISSDQTVEAPLLHKAKEGLEILHRRGRLAIVSNAYGAALRKAINKNELDDLLEVVVSGSDVLHPKPNPEGVNVALQELDINPVQALMFDDSYYGLQAARDAGVDQAHFAHGGGHAQFDDIYPAFKISSWQEVIDALQ